MLKIQERSDGENSVTFSLSGRIESQQVDELKRMIETEHRKVSLDLEEVKLVDSDAVRFLSSCDARGIELRNCPPYVHQWILGMQSSKCGP
jgi:anti-anti-sigma regulatory factor